MCVCVCTMYAIEHDSLFFFSLREFNNKKSVLSASFFAQTVLQTKFMTESVICDLNI